MHSSNHHSETREAIEQSVGKIFVTFKIRAGEVRPQVGGKEYPMKTEYPMIHKESQTWIERESRYKYRDNCILKMQDSIN